MYVLAVYLIGMGIANEIVSRYIAIFPFVLTKIINSLGATILDFVTSRLL